LRAVGYRLSAKTKSNPDADWRTLRLRITPKIHSDKKSESDALPEYAIAVSRFVNSFSDRLSAWSAGEASAQSAL